MPSSLPLARSAVENLTFPVMPGRQAVVMYALLFQIEQASRGTTETLDASQFRQLAGLLDHAAQNVPFLQPRLRSIFTTFDAESIAANWHNLPPLTRLDVQEAGAALHAFWVPKTHGRLMDWSTSGSSGTPVLGRKTELSMSFWHAVDMREVLWHNLDLSGRLVAIRRDRSPQSIDGVRHQPAWGPELGNAFNTGPCTQLDTRMSSERQLHLLGELEASCLATHPSVVEELARICLAQHIRLPHLKSVRTFGEALPPDLHDLVTQAWGAKLTDAYSSQEAGIIALQCPEHRHYHAQSSTVKVEVLRPDNTPCAVGETGRIVVTPLHNFAMPLLRYEQGDMAEVGPPCSCGRSEMVLTRIFGRQRQMMRMADGSRRHVAGGTKRFAGMTSIIRGQLAQVALNTIELRLVVRAPLTEDEEDELHRRIEDDIGEEMHLRIVYLDSLPRSEGGKFETFRCEIT